jgi:hypothetical protein
LLSQLTQSGWNKQVRIYREEMSQKQFKISLLLVRIAFVVATILIWSVSSAYLPAALGCWFVNRLLMKQVVISDDDEAVIV